MIAMCLIYTVDFDVIFFHIIITGKLSFEQKQLLVATADNSEVKGLFR